MIFPRNGVTGLEGLGALGFPGPEPLLVGARIVPKNRNGFQYLKVSFGAANFFLPKAVLGTRKPLIVNLSVPSGTDKIYRGVR